MAQAPVIRSRAVAREWAQTFEQRRDLWLPEIGRSGTIEDTLFFACDLYGPSVLVFGEDTTFAGVTFPGRSLNRSTFWQVPADELDFRDKLEMGETGVIQLKGCRLTACNLFNIALAGGDPEWRRFVDVIAPGGTEDTPDET
jgi:hypothetical protein